MIPYFKDREFFEDIFELRKKFKVSVYNGFNSCIWNGGRILDENITITEKEILFLNKRKIMLSCTFTNSLISKEHLSDKNGNDLLNWMYSSSKKYNIKNEIIINSDILLKYIKEKFPDYKDHFNFNFSITAHKNYPEFYEKNKKVNREKIFDYYTNLFEKYDIVVIHSELIPKKWFIDFLIENNYIHKAEIIINIISGCNHCPKYRDHYDLISQANIDLKANKRLYEAKFMGCILPDFPKKFTDGFISEKNKDFFIEIYNNIKFEGRSFNKYKDFIKPNGLIKRLKQGQEL